jgi:hypothetical protein
VGPAVTLKKFRKRGTVTHSIHIDRRFAILDEWLLDLPVSDRAIRLYAILARYADHQTQKAFPSRATLAERLRCSPASIDRAAKELVEHGAMSKRMRFNSSIVYTLHTIPQGVCTTAEGGYAPVQRGVSTTANLTRATQPEPKNKEVNPSGGQLFDQFWSLYPRKLGTGEARQAFAKAVKVHGAQVILDGVQRFAADPNLPEAQFIPRAATWLNQERWNDAPYEASQTGKGQERLSRSPYVGGPREWVKDLHDLGDHYECRPGEFGCKP